MAVTLHYKVIRGLTPCFRTTRDCGSCIVVPAPEQPETLEIHGKDCRLYSGLRLSAALASSSVWQGDVWPLRVPANSIARWETDCRSNGRGLWCGGLLPQLCEALGTPGRFAGTLARQTSALDHRLHSRPRPPFD